MYTSTVVLIVAGMSHGSHCWSTTLEFFTKFSHRNPVEDQTPVNYVYGRPIFSRVPGTFVKEGTLI